MLLLLFLVVVPVAAWYWARRNRPAQLWLITGATFGAVADPFSIGLYATMILPPLGVITGLIGFAASNFHALPGYEIATAVGLVEDHHVVGGIDHLWISGANALVWGVVYGAVGWVIDSLRNRKV